MDSERSDAEQSTLTAPGPDVDPTFASSAAQYVALLRRVRDQSGLTYRAIARRAQANGEILPASTLATMFGRATLPRRELVVALLRACDVPAARMGPWVTSWQRLAAERGRGQNPLRLLPPVDGPEQSRIPSAGRTGEDDGTLAGVVGGAVAAGAVAEPVPGARRLPPTTGPTGNSAPLLLRRPTPVNRPAPFQLPPPPIVVVGRTAETRRMLDAMAVDGAVCVVEGAGGVGKSALALHLSHQVAARHPGGCLYADLHGVSAGIAPADPAEVLARFLRAMGASTVPPTVEEASTLLRTMTAAQGVLMVLDNVASAAQVRPLLLSAAGCTTVVTSRWRLLDLDVTARISLEPLPDGAALALLRRTGGAARVDAEPAAASVIVQRCAGLPLALRIVGGRAAARPNATLAGLADRIDDEHRRLDVLEAGDLSVRASLNPGYRAFDESEQDERRQAIHLFRLASLPDWSDAAAPAVAALADLPVPLAERMLEQLVDAHLLEPSGDVRYGFHDLVRLFARERAEEVEPPPVRAAAMARLTGHLFGTTASAAHLLCPHERFPERAPARSSGHPHQLVSPVDAWAWFEREHTNLLVIARQRLATGHDLAEVRDLVLVVTRFLDDAGYVTEQVQFGELGVEATQRLGDRAANALALNVLAVAMLREGRLDQGVNLLRRVLITQRGLGDRAGEALCLNDLGNALRDRGDLDAAVLHLQASLAIRRELGDRCEEAAVLDNLGLVFQRRRDFTRAVAHHRAGLAIARQCGDRLREALTLINLAETLKVSGDTTQALTHARQALVICREFNHRRGMGLAQQVLGDVHAALGRTRDARRCWAEALPLLDGLDRRAHARLRAVLGAQGAERDRNVS
ncbi:tetratricopeptide repeat protein [Micromonospora sp. NBC_01796]|uniref:tetratricopeptide repeat protein n=1 Tax=Micromonospora sp. NBC_01796 TaxID=2975987 RepID=UPI002DD8802C|nr:tetratricopeptide repeat protein [Micromonospora sp. NBC_01796]WSA84137.1 tetratricopeptide repeat protein [Micromonospora sp. NBC_01796]